MKKRVQSFKNELESQAKEHFKALKVEYLGIQMDGSKVKESYKASLRKLEERLVAKN